MANNLGLSSILFSLLIFSMIIETSFAARNLNENVLKWVKKDHRRFLRAVIHVSNLDNSIKTYTEGFGLKLLKRRMFTDRGYEDALVGFGPENTHFLLELRQRDESNNVFIGTEFGYFGISTQDVYKSVEQARSNGVVVIQEPVKVNETIIAMVQDQDGYQFKFIQCLSAAVDPLSQIMLRVQDLNLSTTFYSKALGMKLFESQNNSQGQFIMGTMGYGTNESETTLLKLETRNNLSRDDGRDGYAMLYISTDNVKKSAEAAKLVIKELGGNIIMEPVLVPTINVKMTGFSDPDGWRMIMVDNKDYQRGTL
ncbi:lactoylglutathione lyase GLX1-like [Benincasa hispida]|uniref:lactoylglutathione lyase GLX1-like n=1 Tax=Benincasa hispida TaxID=102211 RepID=UPI0019003DD2|nr:lactoylglutathione lyase GLX1-like [Benincasa hispida]